MNTAVFLIYMATLSTSGGKVVSLHQMPSMDVCLKAVAGAQVKVPNGGDAETTVTLYCAHGAGK
jgi:hypothetical protein